MLKNLSESLGDILMAVIGLALLVAGAAGAVTFGTFVFLTCWRFIGSAWNHLFSRPWP